MSNVGRRRFRWLNDRARMGVLFHGIGPLPDGRGTDWWRRIAHGGLVWAAAVGWMTLCCGCGDKGDTYEIVPLEGKIESVKVSRAGTGEITVSYYSEKHGQQITGTGLITRETEITINGIVARLQDLREGERIRGEVRVEKKRKTKIQTVLKIYVDRPVPKSVADE